MEQYKEPDCYVAKNKSISVRLNSQSGGMFSALSEVILNEGGAVYGCVLDEKWNACHIRGTDRAVRNNMRGSKYVQSDLKDVFKQVRADLNNGISVLFSGTSCQISGLKAFLKEDYDNLYCVDILCHGVVSPDVWQKYLKWQESRFGKCIGVNFRNKKFGWHSHYETLVMEVKGKHRNVKSNIYTSVFYGENALRPACYHCPYKEIMHPGDITISDAWGVEKANPQFDDNQGCSLVLLNNNKGSILFKKCTGSLEYFSADITQYMQPPLREPSPKPVKRKQFWRNYTEKPFRLIAKKYGGYGIRAFVKKSMIRFLECIGYWENI